jgi:hypothetical protein
MTRIRAWLKRWWWGALALVVLGGYWLVPVSGRVVIETGSAQAGTWPRLRLDPPVPRAGDPVVLKVSDTQPWTYVRLTVNGRAASPSEWGKSAERTWTWTWALDGRDLDPPSELVFYHDCDTGCVERGRFTLGEAPVETPAAYLPTKLGVVFADPDRDWHGRSGWDVELTYARLAEDEYWGIDDLAWRVQQAVDRGLRVLVRVDYDQGQSIPPAGEHLALDAYLAYLQRLARDARLKGVYGYVLGSGYNSLEGNAQLPERPVTPEWYARMLNGYGEPPEHADNAIQVIRRENPHVRVLVGPVRPWNADQDGARRYRIDVPWLNYMNTLVAALDESARAKLAAGTSLVIPDGFALHTPGWVDAPTLGERERAQEPHRDLGRAEWGTAQAGFRTYRDWLAVINAHESTRGLPVYISSTNTFARPDAPPAENYPPGWLVEAYAEIRDEPQVRALCWFIDRDRSGSQAWDWFSLAAGSGRMAYAAEEFDRLLAE